MNHEAKVRRSTRLEVLGKAKVMSFEDLEEARAKRAEKDKVTADKLKRGRKRKTPVPEAEPEPEREPTRWKAPVTRMY
ncbi:hypothetical protein EJ04DRAFT_571277 [Polyplosphaeria fusca]|uniref:Uncharacterized protein n=1 Tax=Polyplosphaeria fusca TaxID=682080 RepID=A0A9P4QFP2_9PLEO|nr:hypothetical protein EJ04DRAFT_571277 [Polyplosphaeria fusca]